MKNTVVIAHYNENLDWVKNINPDLNICIYSKTDEKYNYYPINKGNEAQIYLKYIVDYYNKLPNKILFLHGHDNSYHQDFDSIFICNNINWDLDEYFSVNRRDYYQEVSKIFNPREYGWLVNNWNYLFNDIIKLPDKLLHYACSQFAVSKNLILNYPKDFYLNLLTWINLTNLDNSISGRLFEYTWNYIFTKNISEKKYENNQIFKNV